MLERINIIDIIVRHFKTLKRIDSNVDKTSKEDWVLFILVPIIFSIIFTCKKISLDNQVSNLIAAISIFGGFLFNLLAIIYGLIDKIKKTENIQKKTFAKEIHSNISFNILVSIFCTVTLLCYGLVPPVVENSKKVDDKYIIYLKSSLLFLNYFLLLLFLLTLIMVLNRVFILLQRESEDS